MTKLESELEDIKRFGFSYIKSFPEIELKNLAFELGIPILNKRDKSIIKEIRPESIEGANPNTLSSRYGMSGFPYHTETAFRRIPIRYLILYCENPGNGNRPTLLLDSLNFKFTAEEITILQSEVWKVTQILKPFLTTVLTINGQNKFIRFDMDCMLPATAKKNMSKTIIDRHVESSESINIYWEAVNKWCRFS